MEKVLITGGSGMIGSRLTELLVMEGIAVNQFGRGGRSAPQANVKRFNWDINNRQMDPAAFAGVDTIIHLAGAGVADKRWTKARKKEIIDSRVKSAGMIYDFVRNNEHNVRTFITASAVGYYGDCGDEVLDEEHLAGSGFLAEVCKQWEQAAADIGRLGIREVCCRIGIVLAKQGGALPELTKTFSVGIAGYFAKANLYYPWVYIDDVCGIMIYAGKNQNVAGAYNTTAPTPLLMKNLIKRIVAAKSSKAILAPTPAFVLKLALGEMSEMLLSSNNCSAAKIQAAGYRFKFPEVEQALKQILSQ